MLLVYIVAQQSLLNPKPNQYLIQGPVFGAATVVVMLNPIYASTAGTIDARHITLMMSGFLGGWPTALVTWLITSAYRLLSQKPNATLAIAHLFVCAGLGSILHYLPERLVKGYKFGFFFVIGLPLIYGLVILPLPLPQLVTWVIEPTGWFAVVFMQALSYAMLRGFFILRHEQWRRTLLDTMLSSGHTHLMVISEQGKLLASSQPLPQGADLIKAVNETVLQGEQSLLRKIINTGEPITQVLHLKNRGNTATYHASFARAELPSGCKVLKVILDDVSHSGQSLALLERFFSLSADGMVISDMAGQILKCNESIAQILGYTIAELQELRAIDLMVDPRWEDVQPEYEKAIALGQHYAAYGQFAAKDGSTKTLSWTAAPAPDDKVFIVARDVTEHKRDELALAQMAAVVEQSENVIVCVTRAGRILTGNYNAQRTWSQEKGDLYGAMLNEFVDPAQHTLLQRVLAEVIESGLSQRQELQCKNSTGDMSCFLATFAPLRTCDGEISGISIIARDITKQKNLEAELSRLDRLDLAGQMAVGIGHEIRNPMTTVRGFLQFFKGKPDLAQYKDQFDLIISELDRCNTIIGEFLSLAKNRVVEYKKVQLNSIVQALEPLIQSDAAMAGIDIELDLQEMPELYLDTKEMRQLILNLTRNGFDAMAHTGGVLTIATRCEEGRAVLEVIDQGTGIPPEIAERIGTPFFTTKGSGTGLGLAVCYSIANHHGASMNFVSSNLGTTFSVQFPRI